MSLNALKCGWALDWQPSTCSQLSRWAYGQELNISPDIIITAQLLHSLVPSTIINTMVQSLCEVHWKKQRCVFNTVSWCSNFVAVPRTGSPDGAWKHINHFASAIYFLPLMSFNTINEVFEYYQVCVKGSRRPLGGDLESIGSWYWLFLRSLQSCDLHISNVSKIPVSQSP